MIRRIWSFLTSWVPNPFSSRIGFVSNRPATDRPSIEVPLTREAWVAVHLEAMTARWQSRAALALGRIATPEAKALLRDALKRELRAGVRAAVEAALR